MVLLFLQYATCVHVLGDTDNDDAYSVVPSHKQGERFEFLKKNSIEGENANAPNTVLSKLDPPPGAEPM